METLNIAYRVDITSQIKHFTPFVHCMQGMFLFMSLPENERTENELYKVRSHKKKRYYLGIFPKRRTPRPPTPPFWEPLIQKFFLVFILHFRT